MFLDMLVAFAAFDVIEAFAKNKGYLAKRYACIGLGTASIFVSTNLYLTHINKKHYPDAYNFKFSNIFYKSALYGFIWPIIPIVLGANIVIKDEKPDYVDEYFFGKVNRNGVAAFFYNFKKDNEKKSL